MNENQSLPEGPESDITSTTCETNEPENNADLQQETAALESIQATVHEHQPLNEPQITAESTKIQLEEANQVEPTKPGNQLTSMQTHEELPTFDPGHDHTAISTKWSRWLEVWELYLASKELDKIENESTEDYER